MTRLLMVHAQVTEEWAPDGERLLVIDTQIESWKVAVTSEAARRLRDAIDEFLKGPMPEVQK